MCLPAQLLEYQMPSLQKHARVYAIKVQRVGAHRLEVVESSTWENSDIASFDARIGSTVAASDHKPILKICIGDMTSVENLAYSNCFAGSSALSD